MTVASLKRFTLGYLLIVVPMVGWATFRFSHDLLLSDYAAKVSAQLALFSTNVRGEIAKYEFLPRVLANDSEIVRILKNPDDLQQIGVVNQKLVYTNRISKASNTYLRGKQLEPDADKDVWLAVQIASCFVRSSAHHIWPKHTK